MSTTEQLDVRKTVCPMTVISVLRKVKSLKSGDCLSVLIADEAGLKSISTEMKKNGHQCQMESGDNGDWKLIITLK